MATKKTNIDYIWDFVSYTKFLQNTADERFASIYKMLPTNHNIRGTQNFFDTLKTFKSEIKTIDVLHKYPWTISPEYSRNDAPYIILKEKRLWKNNTIAKFIYGVAAGVEFIDKILGADSVSAEVKNVIMRIKKLFNNSVSTNENNTNSIVTPINLTNNVKYDYTITGGSTPLTNTYTLNEIQTDVPGNIGVTSQSNQINDPSVLSDVIGDSKKYINNLFEYIKKNSNEITQLIDDLQFAFAISGFKNTLDPYKGLYLLLNSGFKYILPYFNNEMRNISNNWTGNEQNLANILVDKMNNLIDFAGSVELMASTEKQGFYFEKPKPYQFNDGGTTFNIRFPLSNTGTYSDVVLNWQFVFLLIYQNLPDRKDMVIINPPVLYEVEIPGVKYIPYAFIKSLNIEYKGARRMMKIPFLKNGVKQTINTIIPDAFEISINIESLTKETTNMLTLKNDTITTNTTNAILQTKSLNI